MNFYYLCKGRFKLEEIASVGFSFDAVLFRLYLTLFLWMTYHKNEKRLHQNTCSFLTIWTCLSVLTLLTFFFWRLVIFKNSFFLKYESTDKNDSLIFIIKIGVQSFKKLKKSIYLKYVSFPSALG